MRPTKLTLEQCYLLLCCSISKLGTVYLLNRAPPIITLKRDGREVSIDDVTRAGKVGANGLVRRGLMTVGHSVYHITDAGRAALAEREDLVRDLCVATDARRKATELRLQKQDEEWFAKQEDE